MVVEVVDVHGIIQQLLVQVDQAAEEDVVYLAQQILAVAAAALDLVDLALLFFQYQPNFILVQEREPLR
jgi:hypothetical protein